MANINLLPEDLRKKEEKELKKSSKNKRIVMDMNVPQRNGRVNLDESLEKPSFWQRIFGTPNIPMIEKTRNKSFEGLRAPVTSNLGQPNKPIIKTKEKWSDKVLGKAESPIKEIESYHKFESQGAKPIKQNGEVSWNYKSNNSKENNIQNKITIENTYNTVRDPHNINEGGINWKRQDIGSSFFAEEKPKQDHARKENKEGWLDILRSMFFPHRQKLGVNLASEANDLNRMRQMVKNDQYHPSYHKENHKEKAHDNDAPRPKGHLEAKKDKVSNQYHLAPKSEKGNFDINLIPEELIYQTQQNPLAKVAVLLLLTIIGIGLVAASYYYIDYQQSKISDQIALIQEENVKLSKELNEYKKIQEQNNLNARRVTAIGNVLESHIYWSKFFKLLEKNTLDDVYFSSFSADTSGAIALPAVAKDYNSAINQIAAFRQAKDFAQEVKVNSMQMSVDQKRGTKAIGFEIKVILAKNIFKQTDDQGN
ncbi:MAG: hypothetical protein WCV92_04495 [Candidatus Buchananbacteria bacterium]